jgi:hypothetical protein
MARTLGVFIERHDTVDLLWGQCEGAYGSDGDLEVRAGDASAERVLTIGSPIPADRSGRLRGFARLVARLSGQAHRRTLEGAWARLAGARDRTSVLFYEPPTVTADVDYALARRHAARVYGPDARATHPIVLPATWRIEEPLATLRDAKPPPKPVSLAVVTSGKDWLPGHRARLDFLGRLRAAGVPFELYGRNLPARLGSRGPVASKAQALRPARFALAVENFAGDDLYVTEKLWDPLLCWCLPLYYGSRAADRLVPSRAFVRIPDLKEAGVEAVRAALARPDAWESRLDAIAEARRRVLGDLRMVAWARRELFGDGAPTRPA